MFPTISLLLKLDLILSFHQFSQVINFQHCNFIDLPMSHIMQYDERAHRLQKSLQYKQILDEQVREKSYRKRINNRHQFQQESWSAKTPKNRRFVEQSVFLPSISRKQYPTPHYLPSRRFYDENNEMTTLENETEIEADEYLNECERIINNLKKLTANSSRKLSNRKKTISELNSNYYGDESQAREHSPHNLLSRQIKAQKQILRIGVPSEGYLSSVYQKKAKQKCYEESQQADNKKTLRKGSRNGIMSEGSIKNEKGKMENIIDLKNKNTKVGKIVPNSNSANSRSEFNNEFDDVDENDENVKNSIENDEQQQKQRKQDEQLNVAKIRQHSLLKYLNKAKNRGCRLHEKIAQHRKMHKLSANPNKQQSKEQPKLERNPKLEIQKNQGQLGQQKEEQDQDVKGDASQNQNQKAKKDGNQNEKKEEEGQENKATNQNDFEV